MLTIAEAKKAVNKVIPCYSSQESGNASPVTVNHAQNPGVLNLQFVRDLEHQNRDDEQPSFNSKALPLLP